MYNDKRRLYQLMDAYLRKLITGWTFCDEFHVAYTLNFDDLHLEDFESEEFGKLCDVASRYNPFKEDRNKCPGFFCTGKELTAKVRETQERLNAQGYGNGITFVMENQSDE